jgi:hypothetical protein
VTGDEGGETSVGRFETFDANPWYVVVRDDDGYGVWRTDDLEDSEPIERFSDDDVGYEAAAVRWKKLTNERRHQQWLPGLKWVVMVSAIVWVISGAISGIVFFALPGTDFGGPGLYDTFFRWSQLVNGVAMPLTLGGFAIYAVIWLEARRTPLR